MKPRTYDTLSYPVHTNGELSLMLAGRKPLAMFYAVDFELPNEWFIPDEAFAPHVHDGRMLRVTFNLNGGFSERLGRDCAVTYVLFALREESWRIPAMRLLLTEKARTNRWNETCERMQGVLLGYSDEQNDEWCEGRFED